MVNNHDLVIISADGKVIARFSDEEDDTIPEATKSIIELLQVRVKTSRSLMALRR